MVEIWEGGGYDSLSLEYMRENSECKSKDGIYILPFGLINLSELKSKGHN